MKINPTQKRYYKYLHNSKLSRLVRGNLKPVTIHEVINSKVNLRQYNQRGTQHRELKLFNNGQMRLESVIKWSFERNNSKIKRLLYKRYKQEFLTLASKYEVYDISGLRYQDPFIVDKGYRIARDKFCAQYHNKTFDR